MTKAGREPWGRPAKVVLEFLHGGRYNYVRLRAWEAIFECQPTAQLDQLQQR